MNMYCNALKVKGVAFNGKPRYIDYRSYIDPIGGVFFGDNIVISTNVIILTHDYSYTVALISVDQKPSTDIAIIAPVKIGDNCFIGAGAIILPGTELGDYVIVGAGAVVKGCIKSDSVVVGNPCKVIGNTKDLAKRNQAHIDELRLLIDRN